MNTAAYLQGVIVTGALTSAILSIFPRSAGSGKYVRYAAQLMMLLVLISPISSIVKSVRGYELPSFHREVGESTFERDAISYSAVTLSKAICERCADEFSLDEESISVKLILDEEDTENIKINEVQIFLTEKEVSKRERVREYFEELLNTRVFVFGP